MGLMMELLSETEEQTMVPGEATVRTRCLAMFATPMRERAAKDSLVNTKAECKRGFQRYGFQSSDKKMNKQNINIEKQTCFSDMQI